MLLKSLINKSHYGTTGYISSLDNLSRLEQYIIYNLPVLKEFENIIIATNYKEENKSTLIEHNSKLWKKYFPNCIIIDSEVNRGHSFGTTDLDNMVFDYCKENNIEWLCKSDNDIILQETLFNKEIDEADFYYFSGIGLVGMVKYNFDFNEIIKDYFYPQTF
jgi:GT2 family glycosyltransferase